MVESISRYKKVHNIKNLRDFPHVRKCNFASHSIQNQPSTNTHKPRNANDVRFNP